MASPTAVTQAVQQRLTNGNTGTEPVLPNQTLGGAPTPSPAFAPQVPQQAPATPATVAATTPTPGTTKTFTNGNTGRWDGQGWVHVG